MRPSADGLIVAVVGATGMVGRELVGLLQKRAFPVARLLPYSSGRRHSYVQFRGRRIAAPAVDQNALKTADLAFFASSDDVSRRHARSLADAGVWVIDDSSAFRLDPTVPLIIPEVNGLTLTPKRRLIAGPNCTMTGLAVAAAELHRRFTVTHVRVATYQAVSGAGREALRELLGGRTQPFSGDVAPVLPVGRGYVLPAAIRYNVIPQVGAFDETESSGEEDKIRSELRKVWAAPKLALSATAVRVPTIRGHALAAWITLSKRAELSEVRSALRRTPGLEFSGYGKYPTPRSAGGKDPVFAGRLRQGASPNEFCLWIVSDNLMKGAALNSIQIAEHLSAKGWLRPRTSRVRNNNPE